MDLLQHLPDDLVLQEIIPRLDSGSRVRATAVSRLWRDLSRRAPPPADDGIPWMWLVSDLELGNSLIQPPPCSLPTPHNPSSLTARMGAPLGFHGQYALFEPPQPPQPPPTSMIGPLPEPCMLLYNTFHPAKSFRIPSNGFQACQLAQLSCFPDSSISCSNMGEPFQPSCVVVAVESSRVYLYHPRKHEWKSTLSMAALYDQIFYKDELYCIDKKRKINALDVPKYLSNKDIVMATRVVVPPRDDVQPAATEIHNHPVINYYLVESSCTGGLLLVTRYDHGYRIVTCTVHRVEEGKLVEVVDLGDAMLFVRKGCSRSLFRSTYSRPSLEFFTNNSIYFFHEDKKEGGLCSFSLGKFSLGNRSPDNIATFHPMPIFSAVRPCWISAPIPKY